MKKAYIRVVACTECNNVVDMDNIKPGVFYCPVCGQPMVVREGNLFKLYQEKVEELENPTPKKKAPEKPEPKKAAVKVKVKKKQ